MRLLKSLLPVFIITSINIPLWQTVQATEAELETYDQRLQLALLGQHREAENRSRDPYRHPIETLQFFQLEKDLSVVEIWPGGGWYTEILAPITRDEGKLYLAGFSTSAKKTPQWRKTMKAELAKKLAAHPEAYDHAIITELSIPESTAIAPEGTVDRVLTFRNVHNWLKGDYAEEVFVVMARALKPGGKLGVVEHRAKPGTSIEQMKVSGYVTEQQVIHLAEKAGLELEAKSEINANPKDSSLHPDGVWSLPPTLRLCKELKDPTEKATCQKKYKAIGESDRMTLLFHKPKE